MEYFTFLIPVVLVLLETVISVVSILTESLRMEVPFMSIVPMFIWIPISSLMLLIFGELAKCLYQGI